LRRRTLPLTGLAADLLGSISFMSFDFRVVSRALIRRFLRFPQKNKKADLEKVG
jgi:hypothetical protein